MNQCARVVRVGGAEELCALHRHAAQELLEEHLRHEGDFVDVCATDGHAADLRLGLGVVRPDDVHDPAEDRCGRRAGRVVDQLGEMTEQRHVLQG